MACVATLLCANGLADPREAFAVQDDSPQLAATAVAGGADPEGEPGADAWRRDGVVLRKGSSSIELVGYVQPDFRRFDWEVEGDEDGESRVSGFRFRRLRMGSKAQFGNVFLTFVIDPRNSQKGSRLKDVTVGYAFSPKANLLTGYFKPSIGQEFLTSGSKTDLADRSMASDSLSPDREWGAELTGSFGRIGYAAGLFAGDGNSQPESAGVSASARLSVRPLAGLIIAGSAMQGEVKADTGASPDPKGLPGESVTGFTFWERPFVNGTRRRLGSNLSYSKGPFQLQAEYLETRDERRGQGVTGLDLPDVRGRGWNAQVSYVVTGESKGETVTPKASLFKGGRGALELVARIEHLGFDDTGPRTSLPSLGDRAGDIAASGVSAIQVGANYWAAVFMKVQSSALWETYKDVRTAPVPGRSGRYFTLVLRVQFIIP